MDFFTKLLDFIFPRICLKCGKEGTDICDACIPETLTQQQCPHCRKPTDGGFCSSSCQKPYHFDRLIVCCKYESIKKLIIAFKYKFNKNLLPIFKKIIKKIPGPLVPAPIHKKNFKKRGFNQALLLAELIDKTQIHDILKEKSSTQQQAHLDRAHRLTNLKDSIIVTKTPPKSLTIIDDVATTLSTINECSRVLKSKGTLHITAIVLARGD